MECDRVYSDSGDIFGGSMQVACEHCGTEYSLDKENITGRGVRITCPSCSHVFTVYKPQEEIEIDLEIDLLHVWKISRF